MGQMRRVNPHTQVERKPEWKGAVSAGWPPPEGKSGWPMTPSSLNPSSNKNNKVASRAAFLFEAPKLRPSESGSQHLDPVGTFPNNVSETIADRRGKSKHRNGRLNVEASLTLDLCHDAILNRSFKVQRRRQSSEAAYRISKQSPSGRLTFVQMGCFPVVGEGFGSPSLLGFPSANSKGSEGNAGGVRPLLANLCRFSSLPRERAWAKSCQVAKRAAPKATTTLA